VVRALEYLGEQGWIELKASEVRQRYTRLRSTEDPAALTAELMRRFAAREAQETLRLQQVLALLTHDGCQVHQLVRHFGEERPGLCGHCSWCQTRKAQGLPGSPLRAPLPAGLDVSKLEDLRGKHPKALAEPRQIARFLCGLSSPAISAAKLGRNELFGALEERRFADVLEWCSNPGS
jgi:ATP-dependent DNA helicase RecQ